MASPAITVALLTALLFIIISSQPVYKLTNGIVSRVVGLRLADAAGNPTRAGLVVHALVFFACVYAYGKASRA